MSALPKTIRWVGGLDGHVAIIDQTRLPGEVVMLACRDVETIWDAIKQLRIRGAPAIGIAAAMGVVLGVRSFSDRDGFLARVDEVCAYLASSRPTAVNLPWALKRMADHARSVRSGGLEQLKTALLVESQRIHDEDAAMCRAIGRNGLPLIGEGIGVLTHCNAGALATGGCGTALAPIYAAHEAGRRFRVFADETRPLLQGARLTAWELQQAGMDVTLLCDNMAASLMREGRVDIVITGADRIAANGDVANKIGTYSLALIAAAHDVPFYVAAPSTTFDLATADGSAIPIEYRDADEIRFGFGKATAPVDVACYCPAFDVTPAGLVRGIVTERGLVEPVAAERIRQVLSQPPCPDT